MTTPSPNRFDQIRNIPRRQVFQITLSHAVLLAGCLWGGLPYVVLQALVAAEVILVSLASTFLYPERGFAKHLRDLAKLCAGLLVLMFFVVATAAVVTHANDSNPLLLELQEFRDIKLGAVISIVVYVVVHLVISLVQARRSSNPRMTWLRDNVGVGATGILAMVFMVFIAFLVAKPILTGFASSGVIIDANVLLASLMVVVRFCGALIIATFSESTLNNLAENPYEQA